MKLITPCHVQVETVHGLCTGRCVMCSRSQWTRKRGVMSNDMFARIMQGLRPHRDRIRYVSLHFCGEPLLDKGIADKVRIAKGMGFRGTGFATNCTELDELTAKAVLEAGLDTIICSIDGLTKQTHESIRVGINFEKVVANVKTFLRLRRQHGRTRVMIRFIRQPANSDEWPDFQRYWAKELDPDIGDEVAAFDVHNWGGTTQNADSGDPPPIPELDGRICDDVFRRMVVYSTGDVGLCCADHNGFFKLGNVLESDCIEIYNNKTFRHYRQMMRAGRILDLQHCRACTIPLSRERWNET